MILRGAALADKRLTLESGRQDRIAPPPKNVSAPARPAAAPVLDTTPPERPNIALAPPPPPLSVEVIAAWLANQDDATRAELAAQLAEDVATLKTAAETKGFEAGHTKGWQEAQSQTHSILAALAEMTRSAEAAFSRESSQLAEQCTDIVSEVLTKIAGPLLGSREAALGAVMQVLQRIKDGREIVIKVSPRDLPALQLAQENLASSLGGRRFTLVADSQVTAGGCIVETQLGSLDARLDVQLRTMCEALEAARSASQDAP